MHLLGLICVATIVGFVVFAFRKGFSVKPDRNRRTEDWPNSTLGGS